MQPYRERPYRERVWPPVTWYLVAVGLVGSLAVAALVIVGPWGALGFIAVGAVVFAALVASQATAVSVEADGTLWVGRAHLGPGYRGAVAPLEPEQTRLLLHRDADPRAWLAIRPYLDRAVRVDVADAADPHPYWLVGTRTPRRLAAALEAGTAPAHHDRHDPTPQERP